ncbi:MAG: hypothetical protein EB084_25495 [Proteobacteria bacterium]|nr:hypothetical protein [Pseudomonadota bacterium]
MAYNGPVPEVRYRPAGDVTLLYENNPEQITTRDLADRSQGGLSLYSEVLRPGSYRNFFEHLNRTGGDIGFTARVSNPGTRPVEVVVGGSGVARGLDGADAFRDALTPTENPARTLQLPPGARADLLCVPHIAAAGAFFSGVVDFTVRGGEVKLDDLAFIDASNVTPDPRYMGYVRRVEPDGTREARMYKGNSPQAEVVAENVDYTFTDADRPGTLPARHATYDLDAQAYTESRIDGEGWISNIGPAADPRGIASDMLSFDTPGWGRIDALSPTDGTGTYPNLGNWGVLYRITGTLRNQGTSERQVEVHLRANERSGATVAYEGPDKRWASRRLRAGETMTCRTIRVPAGQSVRYTSAYVLGGPSGGDLRQCLTLEDVPPAGR